MPVTFVNIQRAGRHDGSQTYGTNEGVMIQYMQIINTFSKNSSVVSLLVGCSFQIQIYSNWGDLLGQIITKIISKNFSQLPQGVRSLLALPLFFFFFYYYYVYYFFFISITYVVSSSWSDWINVSSQRSTSHMCNAGRFNVPSLSKLPGHRLPATFQPDSGSYLPRFFKFSCCLSFHI